jgi:putative heme-binding domain-containing protein
MISRFHTLAAICVLIIGVIGHRGTAAEPSVGPHWIWHHDTGPHIAASSGAAESCRLERQFQLSQAPTTSTLRFAGDFCNAEVEINGRPVARVEAYSPTIEIPVTTMLRPGENRVSIAAHSVGGPAAVALSITLTSSGVQQLAVATNSLWHVAVADNRKEPAVSLGLVDEALWGTQRRPAAIDPFDNYEQWRQALGGAQGTNQPAFWLAANFAISLVRQAQPEEGSWVSMAFDPRGRITIGREDKGLLRMTLDAAHQSVERVETINDELQECRGLLYAYDALYANANNSKGLYRLRDTDGDDQFDEVRMLRGFPGSVGHGRNDLALGPDGLIYSIHGDAVDIPKDDVIDYTSPFREARRGKNTREGHLLRTDRDGKRWELLAAGLRNPFGIAFHPRGDLFTYDADAEFDMGSPWYRPTRIDQLGIGSDFGWRGVTGKWPPYFPDHADNASPALDIGKGSPTAVAFGTQTSFPAGYRQALFVLDWAYGRVLAVHLAPRGAGYRAQAETFLKGRPLNVTDLAVGPDGALYLITGGRKTQSALYRVASTVTNGQKQLLSAHEEACHQHADAVRGIIANLEACYRPVGRQAVDFAWPYLDAADPRIRYAARTAVEHQPVETWRERALGAKDATELGGLVALARSGKRDCVAGIIDRLARLEMKDLAVSQSLALTEAYFLCWQNDAEMVQARSAAILAQLEPWFSDIDTQSLQVSIAGTSASLGRELARLLALLGSPSIVEQVSRSLLRSDVQEDRLQGLFVLRNVASGWTKETRRLYFTTLSDAEHFVGGEGMAKFVAQIREQAMETLSSSEREELGSLLTPSTSREDEPLPPTRPLVKHWSIDDFASVLRGPALGGDRARGEKVFRDALCSRCHRAGIRGPAVGPDLTHVTGRFSHRDILDSILNPAKVVAENYRNIQIMTTDGRQIVGRIVAEGDFRSEKLRLATEPLRPSTVVELSKREIEQVRESETSPMPQGLLDGFSQQEIIDLLVFLGAL